MHQGQASRVDHLLLGHATQALLVVLDIATELAMRACVASTNEVTKTRETGSRWPKRLSLLRLALDR